MKRRCNGCGWEFPDACHDRMCRFCKTVFDMQYCIECKQWLPKEQFGTFKRDDKTYVQSLCRSCCSKVRMKFDKAKPEARKERNQRFTAKQIAAAEEALVKWKKATAIYFKPMTNEEWLKTCAYFGGCAICGKEHIESREFFIQFSDGGRYAVWNMFPMCGACAKHTRFVKNPFIWLDKSLGSTTRNKLGMNEERRIRLINYLASQIKGVVTNGSK